MTTFYYSTERGYRVSYGTGRRERHAFFGCTACRRKPKPNTAHMCDCLAAAHRFASVYGPGATISRDGVVLHVEIEQQEVAA